MAHGDDERPSQKPKFSNNDDGKATDYRKLEWKPEHPNRPLWICPDGRVLLETNSAFYEHAQDFLITIAEPVRRAELIHEYNLTRSHCSSTDNSDKAKLVLKNNQYFVESTFPEGLNTLLEDKLISEAKISSITNNGKEFEIDHNKVEDIMKRYSQDGLNYPVVEEYDYRNDNVNPNVGMELKPQARVTIRPYQLKSLSTMFGNGRARSASTIGKSCLCLATNGVSVDQWVYQFKLWSTIRDEQLCRFKSYCKEEAAEMLIRRKSNAAGVVVVTTYSMLGCGGNRSQQSTNIIEEIKNRKWGLILMDEVHVTPAKSFQNVIRITKSHCKLGLTTTLLREDDKISDLNFLIGPKLYEANWLDLAKRGYIANVLCAEVRCQMTKEFFAEYKKENSYKRKQALYLMNPNKFRICEYLIQFHEQQRRGDKIIVFSDNLFTLTEYATKLRKPMFYGATTQAETTKVLEEFKTNPDVNTVFMSKVGDNSLDIPEANVIIEISWHGGSRRQEAQRLGRILRAKKSKEKYNAFFYSLVSSDTREMEFAAKRQQFLVDQGYSYKIVTILQLPNFPPLGSGALSYDSLQDQRALLKKVLSFNEAIVGAEDPLVEDVHGMH
ncbi:putative DNA helicase chromatin remodeling SNF2 family [Rosa chinensis]|uniref:DNA 3'-5' helicase n=1 Tax=Rosa chinensis TaxID=74649 RepID=A0A2P6P8I5_ROSCH|nr:putative DNA helicase chromatin remodeling SNF2 family [Rosa chinensis]